jgi:predicted PurR-regulated permease PerM
MEPNQAFKTKYYVELALILLLLFLLLNTMYQVVSVFLGVFTFAIIFAVSFYSLFEKIVHWLGGRRKLAAILYGVVLLAIVAVPFSYIISSLVDAVHKVQQYADNVKHGNMQPLPDSITGLPLVGPKVADFWQQMQSDPMAAAKLYEPQIRAVLQQVLAGGSGLLGSSFELLLGIIVSAILLFQGSISANPLYAVMNALAGPERGPQLVDASGKAIKGVAVGVMGTGLIAAAISWIGYTIAGIPMATLLAAITFLLVVIQVGPALVVIPVVIWLFSQGQTGWGIFMAVFAVLLLVVDNVVKPMLIARGGKLPILVLFIGVVGGMAAWGFTGMFKGAIILAVAYTLYTLWVNKSSDEASSITT